MVGRDAAVRQRARGLGLIAAMIAVAGCTAGSGEGLDANGRPLDEGGGGGGPLVAEFQSIQDNVFTPSCAIPGCHIGAGAPQGLRLDAANSFALLVGIESMEVPGLLRVAPGNPDQSYIIQKLEGTAAVGERMPLGGPFLPQATVDVIRQWITDGALPGGGGVPAGPPTVVDITPADGAAQVAAPAEISVIFSQDMDAALVNDTTFQLRRSGGDGGFVEGNEELIVPVSVGLSDANPRLAEMDLTGLALPQDDYQVLLVGTGATALASVDGDVLDGDADGEAGGDFTSTFTVAALTLEVPAPAVGGTVTLSASGSPDVVSVTFFVDGAEIATDATRPFEVDWDTTAVADGDHELTAEGSDQAGNTAASVPVPVIVDNTLPTVTLDEPADGANVSGTVTLAATASDATSGVSEVSFLAGGAVVGTDGAAPFSFDLDTTIFADGELALSARAVDAAGNTADSQVATVTVANDVAAPDVTITNPADGAIVSGSVTITATAMDDGGVESVTFSVDGVPLGAPDVSAPYQAIWDTTAGPDGPHTLTAEAVDVSGNSASDQIAVTVDNAACGDTTDPTVSITSPLGGTVTGTVAVTADAADDVGVTQVAFLVDGALIEVDFAAPYTINWDTTGVADGDRDLTAQASDACGNTATSAPVTVTVDNTGPDVSITAPAPGAEVSGTVAVTASANDPAGVSQVRFFVDGGEIGSDNTSPYQVNWDTTAEANGDHDVSAEATDSLGNPGTSAAVTVTVNNVTVTYTDDVQPIFFSKCAPCHTTLGSGDHNIGTEYLDAFLPADDFNECNGLNVGQCTIVLIQNGEMPQGRGCTGDPGADAGNANCLTQEEQDLVQAWIDAGLPE